MYMAPKDSKDQKKGKAGIQKVLDEEVIKHRSRPIQWKSHYTKNKDIVGNPCVSRQYLNIFGLLSILISRGDISTCPV